MLLSAEHVSINFGARSLLTDVNFYLEPGDRVGVIGINGTGKSTFLRVLSGHARYPHSAYLAGRLFSAA